MRPTPRSTRPRCAPRAQRGAVAVIVALLLAVLIGFVGLALDLGKLYVARSELQNSADSCALAAARDLTGATELAVAEAAGITAGHLNYAQFQHNAVQMSVDNNVTFASTVSGPYQTKDAIASPTNIKYVQCQAGVTGIPNWFMQVLNIIPGVTIANASVSASAIATVGAAQTTCAIPVFVCQPSSGSPYTIGQWLSSKSGSPTGSTPTYGPGNFGWAALDGSNSANSIANELAGNYCALPAAGATIGSSGNMIADTAAYNTRFGIYANPYKDPSYGTPDFTGYTYNTTTFSQGANAYPDFVSKRQSFTAYQGDSVTGINTAGTATASNYYLGSDRRLALAPEVDCTALLSSHSAPVLSWDCVLMLDPMGTGGTAGPVHVEYRGSSTMAGSPCATQGVPGSGSSVGPQVPVLVQ